MRIVGINFIGGMDCVGLIIRLEKEPVVEEANISRETTVAVDNRRRGGGFYLQGLLVSWILIGWVSFSANVPSTVGLIVQLPHCPGPV